MNMKRELEEQEAEQWATGLRIQALRLKFEDSAWEKLSSAGEATIPAVRTPEVHWDMAESSPKVVSHHPNQRPPSRGSQHCLPTRTVREIEQLSSQLQAQERIRDSLVAAVAALRQAGPQESGTGADGGRNVGPHQDLVGRTALAEPPGCSGTPEALPKISTGALVDHPPSPTHWLHQGSRMPSLAADLAVLCREGQSRSPAVSVGARPSSTEGFLSVGSLIPQLSGG